MENDNVENFLQSLVNKNFINHNIMTDILDEHYDMVSNNTIEIRKTLTIVILPSIDQEFEIIKTDYENNFALLDIMLSNLDEFQNAITIMGFDREISYKITPDKNYKQNNEFFLTYLDLEDTFLHEL